MQHDCSDRYHERPNGPGPSVRFSAHALLGGVPALWVLALTLAGCQSGTPLGTNTQQPYQWEGLSHHPHYVWHRCSADSAAVFVRLPAHEPLHLRENRDQPFGYALQLDLAIQPLDDASSDSVWSNQDGQRRFQWTGQADPQQSELTARFSFPLAAGRYRMAYALSDLHRGSVVRSATLLDGRSVDAPARCLPFDPATGQPAWDGQLTAGTLAGVLVPPDLTGIPWTHAALPPVDSFPSAPFLDRSPRPITFPDASDSRLPVPVDPGLASLPPGDWTGWGMLIWDASPGLHQWTAQGSMRPLKLPARRPHFPEMRDVPEMIRATRYIATRDEYRTMREARNPKAALDNFWLQFVGRPEQARELIRTYYGRIHDANVFFSGLKEGWSTDRGMVYVVFGHPDRTRRDRFGETWIYGEEGDVNALIFRFSNRSSGDDFNTYELERYPGFRSPWEAMVSSWRRGKIRRR
ncbi:GWxTD domain-containing protein [Flavobacteriales bacterium]|nr:GWxTD domain-containing protein [Flavobacteriales bacterium]